MTKCLTNVFSTLHIEIDGESNFTESGMSHRKLGQEVISFFYLESEEGLALSPRL